jgi:hypothetical protein
MIAETSRPLPSRIAAQSYAAQIALIAERLAPFGMSLDEGSPTNSRRPALMRSDGSGGPVIVTRVDLPSEFDQRGRPVPPPAIDLICDALVLSDAASGLDLRVLCVPSDAEPGGEIVESARRGADVDIKIALCADDLTLEEAGRRRLRLTVLPASSKRRLAGWLERHPFMYSLAVLGEFSFKHPLFGQILCGGPCGLSGAWQFTCTMGKTFVSKRQIERNFLDRPIFEPVRNHPSPIVRKLWSVWESLLREILWGPIALRKAIVYLARRLPRDWLRDPEGVVRTVIATLFNSLECPKSLRNGACGAPTREGMCGELLKYGVMKPCVFYYRNARDLRGERLASRWRAAAERMDRTRVGIPVVWMMRIAAAVAARRELSMRIYPRVDPQVPGASAIVSAMRGRFDGMTLFGSRAPLPPLIARSQIALLGASPRGEQMLAAVRKTARPGPRRVSERIDALAEILGALAREARAQPAPGDLPAPSNSTYERILVHEIDPETRRRRSREDSPTAAGEPGHVRR